MDYSAMLYDAGVVKEGHFPLRSGKHSATYIQKDLLWQKPAVRGGIVNQLCSMIVQGIDFFKLRGGSDLKLSQMQVTGPATGASSWAAIVSDRMRMPLAYCEKQVIPFANYKSQVPPERDADGITKVWQTQMSYGRGFPDFLYDSKVVIVEDIVTTGSSVVKTMEALKENGASPVFVVCIWNRSGSDVVKGYKNSHYIPIFPVIDKKVTDYHPDDCPLCEAGMPLDDPKASQGIL